MRIDVVFSESEAQFAPDFGEVQNVSDGGYELGYVAGQEKIVSELLGGEW